MELFKGEQTIKTGFPNLLLTTRRIRYTTDNECQSMMISELSSIKLVHRSNAYYLILSILGILLLAWAQQNRLTVPLVVISAVLMALGILFYYLSRTQLFEINGAGGKAISFGLQNKKFSTAIQVIELIEQQRLKQEVIEEDMVD